MSSQQIASENLMDIISDKKIMKQRGISYANAIESGLNPKAYAYAGLPTGKMLARLDFKVWNKIAALSLYITDMTENKPYCISVFCDRSGSDKGYKDRAGDIDFSTPNINGTIYELDIHRTKNGNYSIKSAKVVTDNSYLNI